MLQNIAAQQNGINYQYYEGSWDVLPDFNSLNPVTTGTLTNFDISVRNVSGRVTATIPARIDIVPSARESRFKDG